MCDYASVVANYGIELGIRQGKHLGEIRSIVSVYSDGLITLDYALSKTGLTKEAFLNAVSLWESGKLDADTIYRLP